MLAVLVLDLETVGQGVPAYSSCTGVAMVHPAYVDWPTQGRRGAQATLCAAGVTGADTSHYDCKPHKFQAQAPTANLKHHIKSLRHMDMRF